MPDIVNTTHDNSSDEDCVKYVKAATVEAEDAAVVSGGSEEGDPEPERLRAASNDDDGVDEREAPARGESSANLESGRWSAAEHARFVDGLQRFGRRKWIRIAEHVGTRTVIQVRSHAQKYFKKLRRTASKAAWAACWSKTAKPQAHMRSGGPTPRRALVPLPSCFVSVCRCVEEARFRKSRGPQVRSAPRDSS